MFPPPKENYCWLFDGHMSLLCLKFVWVYYIFSTLLGYNLCILRISVTFNKYVQLYNHNYNQGADCFHHPRKFPPLTPNPCQSLIGFLSVYFAISGISFEWNHEFYVFHTWPLSFRIALVRIMQRMWQ